MGQIEIRIELERSLGLVDDRCPVEIPIQRACGTGERQMRFRETCVPFQSSFCMRLRLPPPVDCLLLIGIANAEDARGDSEPGVGERLFII